MVRRDGGSASVSIVTGKLPDDALAVTLRDDKQGGEISYATVTIRQSEEGEIPYLHEHTIAARLGFERPLTLDELLNIPPQL